MHRYRDNLTASQFDEAVSRTRLSKTAIDIGRDYLVNGLKLQDVRKKYGITPERARQIVARISTQASK